MSYSFFSKTIYTPITYLILSVFHNNIENCGSYYNGIDGEYIASIATGEKFYNVYDFVHSITGLNTGDEFNDCYFYDEITSSWIPLHYL